GGSRTMNPRMLLSMALAAALLAALSAPVWSAPPTKEEVLALVRKARALHEAAEYAEAEKLYQQVLADVPRLWGEGSIAHAVALNDLASLYRDTGRYALAEPLSRRILDITEARL